MCSAGCKLVGCGSSVPATVLSNVDLEGIVDTSDEWIQQRTGIKQRRVLGKGELLADHAVEASLKALEMGGVKAEELDMVILGTSSPDDIFGSACQVGVETKGLGRLAVPNRIEIYDSGRGLSSDLGG